MKSLYFIAGYMFSGDVVSAVESYSKNLVNSVMERAEAVYSKFNVKYHFASFLNISSIPFTFGHGFKGLCR